MTLNPANPTLDESLPDAWSHRVQQTDQEIRHTILAPALSKPSYVATLLTRRSRAMTVLTRGY